MQACSFITERIGLLVSVGPEEALKYEKVLYFVRGQDPKNKVDLFVRA